jgi:signal peptidase I
MILVYMPLVVGCDSSANSFTQGGITAKIKTMTLGGKSMEPTIKDGTKIEIDLNAYLSAVPQRGDIIVFKDDNGSVIIKRVVALPGEEVEIKDSKLFIDGIELEEGYLNESDSTEAPADNSVWQVPESSVFVLSDNRANGRDSRNFGCVSYDKIIGKVLI